MFFQIFYTDHFTFVPSVGTWHSYEGTRVKKKKFKKFKKIRNWHVTLTLTPFGQTNGENQIESFLRKW